MFEIGNLQWSNNVINLPVCTLFGNEIATKRTSCNVELETQLLHFYSFPTLPSLGKVD